MRKAEITLEYQNYIDHPPVEPSALYAASCGADVSTVNHWRETWKKNVKANHDKYFSFADHSIGKIFGKAEYQPVIIAGAGPSLKINAAALKDRGRVMLLSCLHNFHFLEDNGTPADYYVSLDAGEVVVEEVYEGGPKTPEEYWAMTKGRTLLCFIGTSPRLLEKWQGEVLFFNAPVPDKNYEEFVDSVEYFRTSVSTGGNVLGACMYIAKAFLGASIISFIGADFCFSYDKKFHAWDSKYDANLGQVLRTKDVFGIPVYTWQSYYNFKGWFECMSMQVPGIYINCSEGGTLGAYNTGNLRSIIQMPLADFCRQMNMHMEMKETATNPKNKEMKILF